MKVANENIWIFYDGQCSFCTTGVRRFAPLMVHYNIGMAPLQDEWVRRRLGMKPGDPLTEMKLLTREGKIAGGVDALLCICREIWWAWPLHVICRIPPIYRMCQRFYRWFARAGTASAGTADLAIKGQQKGEIHDSSCNPGLGNDVDTGWRPVCLGQIAFADNRTR